MSRIVGYADINFAVNSAHLKRAALVTDEIRLTITGGGFNLSPVNVAELMWLQEMGLVSLYDSDSLISEAPSEFIPLKKWPEPNQSVQDVRADSLESVMSIMARMAAMKADLHESDISATLIASSEAEKMFRYLIQGKKPEILNKLGINDNFNAKLQPTTAIEVVLHQMPVPDDTTAWEDILTWRSDEAAREKYRRLKHWVHNVVSGTEQPKHLEDHLLTLLDDYRAHMRLHRMKVRTAQTKSIVVPILETVRDVFTGRWGEWAKAYFTVKEQQHALLEAELKAPGREVAYIVDAQERFGTND